MSVLTYLTEAAIRDNVQTMEGEILSRPALLKTDGTSVTWAADVKISTTDARGRPFYSGPVPPNPWSLPPVLEQDPVLNPESRILHNVPIAAGNRSLAYADVGAAVKLSRTRFGRFEITGFSKSKPGRRVRIAVNLETGVPGAPLDASLTVRQLTLEELGEVDFGGGFGTVPLGAYALFMGTTLMEVRA